MCLHVFVSRGRATKKELLVTFFFVVSTHWITCAAVIRNKENTEFEVPSSEDSG